VQVTPSKAFGWLTTISLRPASGRKHQLRRHCAQVLGCPILGDTRYRSTSSRGVAAGIAGAAKRLKAADGTGVGAGEVGDEGAWSEEEEGEEGDEGDEEAVGQEQWEQEEGVDAAPGAAAPGDAGPSHGTPAATVGPDNAAAAAAGAPAGSSEQQRQGGARKARPPPQGGAGGGRRRDVLSSGHIVQLCLCAADLHFPHPVTGEPVHCAVPEPQFFAEARQAEEQAAAAATAGGAGAGEV
jgi:hypothetical protein